jgi:hypothetical protein
MGTMVTCRMKGMEVQEGEVKSTGEVDGDEQWDDNCGERSV